jgi:hypothetical protein
MQHLQLVLRLRAIDMSQYANDRRQDSGRNLATDCGDHDRIGLEGSLCPSRSV